MLERIEDIQNDKELNDELIEKKELSRIGSNESIPVDCRIIVATNKDLQKEVRKEVSRKIYRMLKEDKKE